jgi:superfamily I DNA and RNA helicase
VTLEVVYGDSRERTAALNLAAELRAFIDSGTVYLGYPVLSSADERVDIDALLITQTHGLVAFLLRGHVPATDEEWQSTIAEQDRLFANLESHLGRHESLRAGRRLAFVPHTVTVFPNAPMANAAAVGEGAYIAMEEVRHWVQGLDGIDERLEHNLQAALQRVTTIKPPKRRASVTQTDSRGAALKEIEKEIANLDRWQKQAAIETPEGPQRIRGLAGSGKTVVLALKAAYLHARHPEWQIALTYYSRALFQQIDDLVTRFTFEHSNDRPDPAHLQIVHSWGSASDPGVYSLMAAAIGETPRDFTYARAKYGMDRAFEGVCEELLAIAEGREVEPIFDVVLIDEAQDLSPAFFQLVYLFTKDPKRIVWAYDELQKLSEATMPTTDELFGKGANNESRVNLDAGPDEPQRDIVLRVCYRNTPWALATAHALGIGVYRQQSLLQHPDTPDLWKDIGYNVVRGELSPGEFVSLQRSHASYPQYFDDLLEPRDAVLVKAFADEYEQDVWVAEQIVNNLEHDELEPDDVLIVLPDTYRAKSRAPRLMRELSRRGIDSHLVGVSTSAEEVFLSDSVALAHIFRAKGNEAPMVYVVDSQYAAANFNAVTRRNTLFTAITRSRAWVRILGWGNDMDAISREIDEVSRREFRLEFVIPTIEELSRLRHIHRDRTMEEEAVVRRATQRLTELLDSIEGREIQLDDLPPALRTRLAQQLQLDLPDDGDDDT